MTIIRSPIPLGTATTVCDTVWENQFKTQINNLSANAVDVSAWLTSFSGYLPTFANSQSILVNPGSVRDVTNTVDITLANKSVISVASAGLSGVLQSGLQSGTVSTNTTYNLTAVDTTNSRVTLNGNPAFSPGQPIVLRTTGTLPTGLTVGTIYYGRIVNSNQLQFYTTQSNALSDTNRISLSSQGSGTNSIDATYIVGIGTAFTTTFLASDSISVSTGDVRRITQVLSDTVLQVSTDTTTTTSSVAYRRGGSAPDSFLYMYAISDNITPGLAFCTRNAAAGQSVPDLPTNYSFYRQLPIAFKLDSTKSILPFYVANSWPFRPLILYAANPTSYDGTTVTPGSMNILNGGTATTYTGVTASSYIPPISQLGLFSCFFNGSNANHGFAIRQPGSNNSGFLCYGYSLAADQAMCNIGTTQGLEYIRQFGSAAFYLDVCGYYVTEVF